MMINTGQIKAINTIKSILIKKEKLTDDDYRKYLQRNFNQQSCTKLSWNDANQTIKWLRYHEKKSGITPKSNVIQLATPGQIWLINEVLVKNIYWQHGDGFESWLKNRMKMEKITTKQDAYKVIEGLKGIIGIKTPIIKMRALPFPIRLDDEHFIDQSTGEVLPNIWVYDLDNKKLVMVENEEYQY